jgi:small-conductance mechanosensitive channel
VNIITNWTQRSRKIRLKLDIGVAYDSDVNLVTGIMKEVCLRVGRVLQDPPPRILILGLGDAAINFQLRFFIDDPENGVRNVLGEIYELLLRKFKEKQISIPFPQREIRLLRDSAFDITVKDRTLNPKSTSTGRRETERHKRHRKKAHAS